MDVELRLRQKLEMQGTHARQMQYKALRVQAEKEEEEQFQKQVSFEREHDCVSYI